MFKTGFAAVFIFPSSEISFLVNFLVVQWNQIQIVLINFYSHGFESFHGAVMEYTGRVTFANEGFSAFDLRNLMAS